MAKGKGMVYFGGIMDKSLKENGKMVWKMDLEYGDLQRVTITKGNGFKIDNMVKAYLNTGLVPIKVNLKISWKMDMAKRHLQMEINILARIKTENPMEEDDMNGLREAIMMGNSSRAWDREKENGLMSIPHFMKVNILIF